MFELTAGNAAPYLVDRAGEGPWRIEELGGGVSNTVLLAQSPGQRLILKQALGKLRVEQDWFADRTRIFRESGAIRALTPHLPSGSVPEVLFEDRENLIFGMTAAPARAENWKAQLMAGNVRFLTAEKIGAMLGDMVRYSWRNPDCEQQFGDQTVFDQLRIDPYYRSTAARHPELAAEFQSLIRESQQRRVSLVHGDWSPKNFLVWDFEVMAIDFEVIHYGDPAFDSGFLLNHLALKSFHRPESKSSYVPAAVRFWNSYRARLPGGAEWIEEATIRHLGCLMLARIDGKSPAEYLRDERVRERVRQFARRLIVDPPATVQEVFACL